jgi:hypothetical protein
MPTVASFKGVTIIIRVNDHPPPHFHAYAGDDEAMIRIEPVLMLHGSLPRARMRDVVDWAQQHQTELQANWRRCQAHQSVQQIPYP